MRNDSGNWTIISNSNTTNNDLRIDSESPHDNKTLLPYHNWTINEYSMPDMPPWIPMSYMTLLCVAIGVGIPGNLITALAYFSVKVKSNCDWYIFFVAVFDLISCTFRVTGYLLEFLGVWAKLTNNSYCLFVSWISQTSVGMSILIVGLIAIDRCIKVSFNSRLYISPSQSRNICLIFTALAFMLGLPTLFIYGNTPRGICIVTRDSSEKPWVQYYYCTIFILLFGMMVSVIFCYIRIAWTVMKNRRVIHIVPSPAPNQSMPPPKPRNNGHQQQTFGARVNEEDQGKHQAPSTCYATSSTYFQYPNKTAVDKLSSNYASTSGNQCPSSSTIQTLSIPQAPKLFVIPGPQTKAIILPQPSPSVKRTIKTANISSTGTTNISAAKNNTFEIAENVEQSLEKVTEMNKRNSDESVKNMIRFSKQQWNKRLARDYKVTGLLFLVTTMFILSWIAPCYASFRAFFVGITFPFTVEDAAFLIYAPNLYIINNFINPIIYLALSSTYRKKVKAFSKRCVDTVSRFKLC